MDPNLHADECGVPVGMEALSRTPQQQQQQQTTSVTILDAPASPSAVPLIQSFAGHIVLACCTFWCCGAAFGLVAFILAVMAQNMSTSPHASDRLTARHLGKASFWISIAGIVIGTIMISILIVLGVLYAKNACNYSVRGKCYAFKERTSYSHCLGKGRHYYDNGYCYY